MINRSKTGDAPKMPVTVQGRRFVRDSGCGNHLGQRSCANATKGRPLPVILELRDAMNAVDGATIERRIRINRPDEGKGRCKGSRAWDRRKDFSQCMQHPTILSTSSAISPQQERTEPSGHRPCRRGVKSSLRREPDVPGDFLRALFGKGAGPVGLRGLRLSLSFE